MSEKKTLTGDFRKCQSLLIYISFSDEASLYIPFCPCENDDKHKIPPLAFSFSLNASSVPGCTEGAREQNGRGLRAAGVNLHAAVENHRGEMEILREGG